MGDDVSSVWLLSMIALVAGGLIGALSYRLLAPTVRKADQIKSELDQARGELDSYKNSVNTHFDKTSQLFTQLTQDYVKVYQHLAEGAQTLSDTGSFTSLMEQQQGKVLISVSDEADAQDAIVGAVTVEGLEEPDDFVHPVGDEAQPAEDAKTRDSNISEDDEAGTNISEPDDAPDALPEHPAETDRAQENIDNQGISKTVLAGEKDPEDVVEREKTRDKGLAVLKGI